MPAGTRASAPSGSQPGLNDSISMTACPGSMPALAVSELRPPSRLKSALWLAAVAEVVLIGGGIWLAARRTTPSPPPPAAERVRLVQLPKPVVQPKPQAVPHRHPRPAPVRPAFHPHPLPRIVPPSTPLPAPSPLPPLPPSPVAAAIPLLPRVLPVPAPVSAAQRASYLEAVKSAIQAAVHFPAQARLLRQDGRVRVSFQLIDGVVRNLKIVIPGRLGAFNANALSAIREASIPSPPKSLAHKRFTLNLWVKFHLHRSL